MSFKTIGILHPGTRAFAEMTKEQYFDPERPMLLEDGRIIKQRDATIENCHSENRRIEGEWQDYLRRAAIARRGDDA